MKKNILTFGLIGFASVFVLNAGVVNAEETSSEVEFLSGDLTISPDAKILFNSYTLTGEFEKIETDATENFNLKVTDATGSRNGWYVQASHTGFTNGSEELEGATIDLSEGSLTNPYSTEGVALADDISIGREAQDISAAGKGFGTGISDHDWTAENIILTIPDGIAQSMLAGNYSATIDWTLTAGPQPGSASAQ